jgi:hypothetical protein
MGFFVSLPMGLAVGVIYGLSGVRSPAPPLERGLSWRSTAPPQPIPSQLMRFSHPPTPSLSPPRPDCDRHHGDCLISASNQRAVPRTARNVTEPGSEGWSA